MHDNNIHILVSWAKPSLEIYDNGSYVASLLQTKSFLCILYKNIPEDLNKIAVNDVTIKRFASIKYIGCQIDENLN